MRSPERKGNPLQQVHAAIFPVDLVQEVTGKFEREAKNSHLRLSVPRRRKTIQKVGFLS
jgi:hypothetical protein